MQSWTNKAQTFEIKGVGLVAGLGLGLAGCLRRIGQVSLLEGQGENRTIKANLARSADNLLWGNGKGRSRGGSRRASVGLNWQRSGALKAEYFPASTGSQF